MSLPLMVRSVALRILIPFALIGPVWFDFGGVTSPPDPRTANALEGCGGPSALVPLQELDPLATGTILDYPEMRIRDRAPVGEDIQSSYFRTTGTNREFRRGFMEFAIPQFRVAPDRVTLIFAEGPGTIAPGAPDVDHELSWYSADGKVDVADFDRPTTFVGGFQDDMQDANNVWSFDVTGLVRGSQGRCLGFRAKLVLDPGEAGYRALGTSIGRYSWITPHLEFAFGST